MIVSLADTLPGYRPPNRILTLTALFWAFSYALLSLRGALLRDDWTRLIDDNRLLAVTVGAGAYALVLRQLRGGRRPTLREAIVWVFGATLAIMAVRLTADGLMFEVPQGIEIHLLWSLTWSAYFALWVMGALAFAPTVSMPAAVTALEEIAPTTSGNAAQVDNLEMVVTAIIAEAADLKSSDRTELAARVLALGGYECVDGSARENERMRLALRIAARLSASN